ncbi:MAG TPA: VWA domain-containing protein [Nannocystaceae bacterium]|nr:VWA domain-containing protein [Nannocystaceae bacterium]
MLRPTIVSRLALLAGAAIALPQLFACLDHPLKPVAYDKSQEGKKGVSIAVNKDVDVVFVIDNSGSMAEEQANLSENFAAFVNVLEAPDVKANYRLAITTTDNGNPRCPKADTTPESGNFVLSSCLGRLPEFVFNGTDPPTDASYACSDYCTLAKADLDDKMKKTTTARDSTPAVRRWLENIEGQTNLPDGVSTVDAFKCFGPQGVAGCGFESHLESMYKALVRADTDGEQNFGFLRDTAILSVVHLTDELDCSHNDAHKAIFIDNKVFWNTPDDPIPTSAVCWRAGVACDGAGPDYTNCRPENYDEMGNPGAADGDAVLWPIQKYIDQLQEIETAKKASDNGQEVLVAVIGGVPTNYPDTDIVYSDSGADQAFLDDFGVGPGCKSAIGGTAMPPVRLRDWAKAFEVGGDPNLFSICSDDYSPALKAIADKIRDQIKPACMPSCIKDVDPTTEIVDESCTLIEENTATMMQSPIPKCEKNGANFVPPAGSTVCYIALVDQAGLTATPDDDMSQQCIDEGWNLEFKLFRSGPAPAGSTVTAVCELSALKSVDCPNL